MQFGYGYFEDDHLGDISDLKLWRRIFLYIAPVKKSLFIAIILSILINCSSLALPYLTRIAIDKYIIPVAPELSRNMQGFLDIFIIFLLIMIFGFIANFLQVYTLELSGQRIMHSMRQHLFTHVLRLNLPFFNSNSTGKLVTRLTNDIQNMHEMFTSVVITIFNDILMIIGILTILFWMNWQLTLLLSIILPIIVIFTIQFSRLARDVFRKIRTNLARINSFIQESISGVSIIHLFLQEKETYKKFRELNLKYYKSNMFQIKIFAVFLPIIEILSSVALALIIWYGGKDILYGKISIGVLVAFIAYMRLFFQPVRELSQKYSIIQSAMASAERIFQLLDIREPVEQSRIKQTHNLTDWSLRFNNVSFSYEPGHPVIHNFSLHVPSGKTVAIIGTTGSGKTTLINLLERFYNPDKGSITIHDRNIMDMDVHSLRNNIGLVMQDIFILPDSIKKDILLDATLSEKKLAKILYDSQLKQFIDRLDMGIETIIGEGGMELSAGQKQLLSLARVLVRDPKILILDEATSNVDTQTEMLIEQAIMATLKNRTSIVIAHRLSTIRRASHIVVMENGRIVEQGTHKYLLKQKGIYHHLQNINIFNEK